MIHNPFGPARLPLSTTTLDAVICQRYGGYHVAVGTYAECCAVIELCRRTGMGLARAATRFSLKVQTREPLNELIYRPHPFFGILPGVKTPPRSWPFKPPRSMTTADVERTQRSTRGGRERSPLRLPEHLLAARRYSDRLEIWRTNRNEELEMARWS